MPPAHRTLTTTSLDDARQYITDHDLTPTPGALGEWSGTIDGQPVTLTLTSPTRARLDRLAQAVTQFRSAKSRHPSGKDRPDTTAARLVVAARHSRWF